MSSISVIYITGVLFEFMSTSGGVIAECPSLKSHSNGRELILRRPIRLVIPRGSLGAIFLRPLYHKDTASRIATSGIEGMAPV